MNNNLYILYYTNADIYVFFCCLQSDIPMIISCLLASVSDTSLRFLAAAKWAFSSGS